MDIRIVGIVKRPTNERYVFLFRDTREQRQDVLRCLGRFASNLELSFTWYDAAVLSQKVRETRWN